MQLPGPQNDRPHDRVRSVTVGRPAAGCIERPHLGAVGGPAARRRIDVHQSPAPAQNARDRIKLLRGFRADRPVRRPVSDGMQLRQSGQPHLPGKVPVRRPASREPIPAPRVRSADRCTSQRCPPRRESDRRRVERSAPWRGDAAPGGGAPRSRCRVPKRPRLARPSRRRRSRWPTRTCRRTARSAAASASTRIRCTARRTS